MTDQAAFYPSQAEQQDYTTVVTVVEAGSAIKL